MSSRVAVKAALLALAFMLVILAISAYSLSVDRNGELTESLAFGCTVASKLLEGAEDDEQRLAILQQMPEDAQMGLAYFDAQGASLYDNRPGRERLTEQEHQLLEQAQLEGVIRYTSDADGSLCVLYAFSDGASLRMSRPGVTAFTVFGERLLIYALIVVGVCALVFALVYIYDMRRRSVIRQVTDVLTDFSDGRYDARIQLQHGADLREEVEGINAVIEQIEQRVFRQRSRDHAISVIMNQMQSGIIVVDAKLHILLVTPVARKLMGIAPNSEGVAVVEACKNVNLESVFGEAMRREGVYTNEVAARTAVGRGHRPLRLYVSPMRQDGKVVGALAMVEDITERRNAEARINHMARFDELTGLPNRLNFRNEIQRLLSIPSAEGSHALSALLFVDLDQFKQVNDTLGHPCGDRLLCAVADRLREMLRPDDFVARFGGDEFVVFQPRIKSIDDAATLARRIVDRLSEGYEIDQHLVEIGASIGIATTSSSGANVDVLLKNADMALYRAKGDGRGTFCFFREEMAQIETRRTLELELRHALANEEFELFYQPLVNLKTGRIATCEALLRWNHPERGFVPPSDIIPVAEDMGLIVDLGRWILRKACMECMQWPSAVSVAVNFSSQQFHRRDVLSDVRYALEVSGLPANRLEIEITESSLLRNTQWTLDVLAQLRAAGVRISLDDFGTGYSSLSYLNNFPLQKVKIDRSFLEGIDKDRPLTLLRGVARLSADLGMSVVVEGVETNDQLELIGIEGTITEAQGYLFSPPVPAHQIRQLLNASHGRRPKEAPLEADGSRSLA